MFPNQVGPAAGQDLFALFTAIAAVPRLDSATFQTQCDQLGAQMDRVSQTCAKKSDLEPIRKAVEDPQGKMNRMAQQVNQLQQAFDYRVKEEERIEIRRNEEVRQVAMGVAGAGVVVAFFVAPVAIGPTASSLYQVWKNKPQQARVNVPKKLFSPRECVQQFLLSLGTGVATAGLGKFFNPALAMLNNPIPAQIALQAGLNTGHVIVTRAINGERVAPIDLVIAPLAGATGAAIGAGAQALVRDSAPVAVRILHAGGVAAANTGAMNIVDNVGHRERWNRNLGEAMVFAAGVGMLAKGAHIRREYNLKAQLENLEKRLEELEKQLNEANVDKDRIKNEIESLKNYMSELRPIYKAAYKQAKAWIKNKMVKGYQLPKGMDIKTAIQNLIDNKQLTLVCKGNPNEKIHIQIVNDSQLVLRNKCGVEKSVQYDKKIISPAALVPQNNQANEALMANAGEINYLQGDIAENVQQQHALEVEHRLAGQAARGLNVPVMVVNPQLSPVVPASSTLQRGRIQPIALLGPRQDQLLPPQQPAPQPRPAPAPVPPPPAPQPRPVPAPVPPPPAPQPRPVPAPVPAPPVPQPQPAPAPVPAPVPPVIPPPPVPAPAPAPLPDPRAIQNLIVLVQQGDYLSLRALKRLVPQQQIVDLENQLIQHPRALESLERAIRRDGDVEALRLVRRIHREVQDVPNRGTLENARLHAKQKINRRG